MYVCIGVLHFVRYGTNGYINTQSSRELTGNQISLSRG